MRIPFTNQEIENPKMMPGMFGSPPYPEFNYPVSHKENFIANMNGKGHWIPSSNDIIWFCPAAYPDNPAKGNVHEAVPFPKDQLGGTDMFGIEWEYVPAIGGSTVRPGKPVLDDVNRWREVIKFPDVNSWDWDGMAAVNMDYLSKGDRIVNTVICTGWFERLISFMDFAEAAMAMIDEDQRDAVNALFDRLSDLYIEIIDRFLETFPGLIHAFTLHDDWAGQVSPFFSPTVIREVLTKPIKRVVDHLHGKGLYADMHCCGAIDMLLPCIEEIGFDRLEVMPLLDREAFYENYGHRMMLSYTPDALPENYTREDCEKAARAFVDQFFNKGKTCMLETYYRGMPAEFLTELYSYARKKSLSFE